MSKIPPYANADAEPAGDLLRRLEELNAIGIALSSEQDISRLLETILVAAKRITHADAGTLYLLDSERQVLQFEIVRTDSLVNDINGIVQTLPNIFSMEEAV